MKCVTPGKLCICTGFILAFDAYGNEGLSLNDGGGFDGSLLLFNMSEVLLLW